MMNPHLLLQSKSKVLNEVLFRDIAAAELKVRSNLEIEALGKLFI